MKRIFLSSVQKEFAEERKLLKKYIETNAILRRFFNVFAFEFDVPATDNTLSNVYLSELSKSDIYIGLIGDNYGFEDSDGISPTEREFDEAKRLKMPRLIFVKGHDDSKRDAKEQKFLKKISPDLIRKRYEDFDSLLDEIFASLDRILEEEARYRLLPFDASFSNLTMSDLDLETISWFAARARNSRGWKIEENANPESILKKLHLIGKNGEVTNAGVLLFAKDPQSELLPSEVKCLHFHGTIVEKPIPVYQVYHGTLWHMIDSAVDFVLGKIDRSVGTRGCTATAPVSYEIPPLVISEAIVNAVCHRNYTSTGSVQVMLFKDRLEIMNPGHLPSSISVEDLKEVHESFPVNPLIAEPMFLAQYAEKVGSGTVDMIRLCKEAGLEEPVYIQEANVFKIIIYRKKKEFLDTPAIKKIDFKTVSSKGKKTQKKIVDYMKKHPKCSAIELSEKVGVVSRVIERHIATLKQEGVIKREGSPKWGYWKVK